MYILFGGGGEGGFWGFFWRIFVMASSEISNNHKIGNSKFVLFCQNFRSLKKRFSTENDDITM